MKKSSLILYTTTGLLLASCSSFALSVVNNSGSSLYAWSGIKYQANAVELPSGNTTAVPDSLLGTDPKHAYLNLATTGGDSPTPATDYCSNLSPRYPGTFNLGRSSKDELIINKDKTCKYQGGSGPGPGPKPGPIPGPTPTGKGDIQIANKDPNSPVYVYFVDSNPKSSTKGQLVSYLSTDKSSSGKYTNEILPGKTLNFNAEMTGMDPNDNGKKAAIVISSNPKATTATQADGEQCNEPDFGLLHTHPGEPAYLQANASAFPITVNKVAADTASQQCTFNQASHKKKPGFVDHQPPSLVAYINQEYGADTLLANMNSYFEFTPPDDFPDQNHVYEYISYGNSQGWPQSSTDKNSGLHMGSINSNQDGLVTGKLTVKANEDFQKLNCQQVGNYALIRKCKVTLKPTLMDPNNPTQPYVDPKTKKTYTGTAETFNVFVTAAVRAKTIAEIAKTDVAIRNAQRAFPATSTNSSESPIFFNVAFNTNDVTNGKNNTLDLAQYFVDPDTPDGTPEQTTYSVVTQNDYQSATQNNKQTALIGGPIVLCTQAGACDPQQQAIDPSNFTIKDNTLTVNKAVLNDPKLKGKSGIIQLQIRATEIDGNNNSYYAFQTIYLNISPENTYNQVPVYQNPLVAPATAKGNGAWVYGAGDQGVYPGIQQSDQNYYTGEIAQQGLQYMYSDQNWIQITGGDFYGPSYWPQSQDWLKANKQVISNNFMDSHTNKPGEPSLGSYSNTPDTANHFYNGDNHIKFIVTTEFDGHLRGLLDSMTFHNLCLDTNFNSDVCEPLNQGVDEVTFLANNLAGQFSDPSKTANVYGMQMDVEPYPHNMQALQVYKHTSDLLARYGKIFQIYAFANAMHDDTVLAIGPLGELVPSGYDMSQFGYDPNHADSWYANDKTCHQTGDGKASINSYCSVNDMDAQWNVSKEMYPFYNLVDAYNVPFSVGVPTGDSAQDWTQQVVTAANKSELDSMDKLNALGMVNENFPNGLNPKQGKMFVGKIPDSKGKLVDTFQTYWYVIATGNTNPDGSQPTNASLTADILGESSTYPHSSDPTFADTSLDPTRHHSYLGQAQFSISSAAQYGCLPGGNHFGGKACQFPYKLLQDWQNRQTVKPPSSQNAG